MHAIDLITNNYIGNTSVFTEVNETIRFYYNSPWLNTMGFTMSKVTNQ